MKSSASKYLARFLSSAALVGATGAVVIACGGTAGIDDPTASSAQAISTITISGNVVDATGFGVFGVTVTLAGSQDHAVITDQNGAFSFSVPPGSYSVAASVTPGLLPPGFVNCPAFSPQVINLNNLTSSATGLQILGSGQNPVTDCFPAPNQGATSGSLAISGKVTSAGAPVPGVKVTLSGSTQGTRVTDETGAYAFAVNPGSYSLTLSQACTSFSPQVVNLNNLRTNQVENFSGTGCPPAPLSFCPVFDAADGLTEPASCTTVTSGDCTFDRLLNWGFDIPNDYLNVNDSDCRFGQFNNPPIIGQFNFTTVTEWLQSTEEFALQLLGCPIANITTGPLSFLQLLPPFLPANQFTTADFAAIQQDFVQALNQALTDRGAPPLTAGQTSAINAQIAFAASRVQGVKNSPSLSFSTCAADAGGQ
jgi:hypothetical protein